MDARVSVFALSVVAEPPDTGNALQLRFDLDVRQASVNQFVIRFDGTHQITCADLRTTFLRIMVEIGRCLKSVFTIHSGQRGHVQIISLAALVAILKARLLFLEIG